MPRTAAAQRASIECGMRLSTLLLSTLAVTTAGVVAWTMQRRADAELRLQVLAAQLEPLGRFDYDGLRVWPWGGGHLETARIALAPAAADRLGLPAGSLLSAARVELLDYRAHDARIPEVVQLRWQDLRWPLPAAGDVAARAEPLRALARLRELGPPQLRIDGDLDLAWQPEDRGLRMDWRLRLPGQADIRMQWSLRGGPELFEGRLDDLELARFDLVYRDRGLQQALHQTPTLAPLLDATETERSLSAAAEAASERMGLRWSAEQWSQLDGFLHQPDSLWLRLDPPGRLRLRDLALYAPADRLSLLGLELAPAPAEAAAPP